MSIIGGVPEPRIVLKSGGPYGTTIDDFTLERFSKFLPDYAPDFLTHEVQTPDTGKWELKRKLHGYRFTGEVYYEGVDGTELTKLLRLLNLNTGYDAILLYPWKTSKPEYYVEATLDDDTISVAYWKLLAHRDFTIRFKSLKLVDYVPLSQASVILAGDISWAIEDIAGAIEDLD